MGESYIANPEVIAAISALQRGDGTIAPEDVVNAARSKKSPLHGFFTWDNDEAAEKLRVLEARKLLRVAVTIIQRPKEDPIRVRAFVSLSADRGKQESDEEGGGYRVTVDVLSDDDLRKQLLDDAKRDAANFARRYRHLQEVAEIVAAIERLTG